MKIMSRLFLNLFILVVALGLTACGGGGGGGGQSAPTPATITADNAESLAVAASESTKEAVVSQNANPYAVSISPDPTTTAVSRKIAELIRLNMSATGLVLFSGDCVPNPGTVEIADPNSTTGSVEFNNYCINVPGYGEMVMNGSVSYSFNDPYLYLTYSNFTVSFGGNVETIDMSVTINMNTFEVSWSSSFVSSDGATVSYADFDISGDPATGVSIFSGRVTYSGVGYFDVYTESPVVLSGCANGRPMSGTIVAEGSSGTLASITFDSCDSYTWCYDLNNNAGLICETGMW
ncbi:hypothetical protein [Kaarinaea lacus]